MKSCIHNKKWKNSQKSLTVTFFVPSFSTLTSDWMLINSFLTLSSLSTPSTPRKKLKDFPAACGLPKSLRKRSKFSLELSHVSVFVLNKEMNRIRVKQDADKKQNCYWDVDEWQKFVSDKSPTCVGEKYSNSNSEDINRSKPPTNSDKNEEI